MNPRFSAFTGYAAEELLGKNPRILASGKTPRATYKELWETIRAGKVWQGDLCNKRKGGSIFWESIAIASIKDSKGRITHFVGMWQDATQRKKAEEVLVERSKDLEEQSRTDDLTGLYNRRHMLVELEKEVARARRYRRRLSGMMLDIDDFKMINDRYGHPMGDRVLKSVAAVLAHSIRRVDIFGRYGGDEFLVILPESTIEIAGVVAQRIRQNFLEYSRDVIGDLVPLTVSIGLLSFDDVKEIDKSVFIERIDQALFQAKRAGKNTITFWQEKSPSRRET